MSAELPDLERAVQQLSGVAAARIIRRDPSGLVSLHVDFAEGVDELSVGAAVIRTLVERGGLDPDTLDVQRGQVAEETPRPVFTRLVLDRLDDAITVDVDLFVEGQDLQGRAESVVGDRDVLHLVAEATLSAVRALTSSQGPHLRVVRQCELVHDVAVVIVVLDQSGDDGVSLVGGAVVGRDAREAAVRATLDAVNRTLGVLR